MRMMEAGCIRSFRIRMELNNREVKSMSDYVHDGRHPKLLAESSPIESRLLFAACYVIFLCRAIVIRLMPRRGQRPLPKFIDRESIFREAGSAASVMVASSFMGL
jgi:hypothetical protein